VRCVYMLLVQLKNWVTQILGTQSNDLRHFPID